MGVRGEGIHAPGKKESRLRDARPGCEHRLTFFFFFNFSYSWLEICILDLLRLIRLIHMRLNLYY